MTGTELLVQTLEHFSESEPTVVLVVWGDEDGNVSCKSNCVNTHTIGLAEYAKQLAIANILRADNPR